MSQVTDTYTTPEVNGTFNDWCGGCAPMADDDADDIWVLDIVLEQGSYEYKFAYDAWTGQEELTEGDPVPSLPMHSRTGRLTSVLIQFSQRFAGDHAMNV